MSQFFTSGGESIGASASTSVLPMNIKLISFNSDCFDFLVVKGTLFPSVLIVYTVSKLINLTILQYVCVCVCISPPPRFPQSYSHILQDL